MMPPRKRDGPRCEACGHLWASHAPNVGCQVLAGKKWTQQEGGESGMDAFAPIAGAMTRCLCSDGQEFAR